MKALRSQRATRTSEQDGCGTPVRASPGCRRRSPAQAFQPGAELVGELAVGKRKDCPPVLTRIGIERKAPEKFQELRTAVPFYKPVYCQERLTVGRHRA